jgi:LPXTG-motif cell wall-anchored protein
MNNKLKLQVFSVICTAISIAALVAGVQTGDGMYLWLGIIGLLGVALLAFAVIRRAKRTS